MLSRLILPGALLAVATFGSLPAEAVPYYYEGPWCLHVNVGRSVSEQCHYRTFEACNAGRFNLSSAFCVQNPRYLPYWGIKEPPARRRYR